MVSVAKPGFSPFSLVVMLVGIIGGVAFGFNNGVFAGVLLFLKGALHISVAQKEFLNGSNLVGAVFGSLILASIADRYGRRGGLWAASIFATIGSLGASQASNFSELMFFRFLGGMAIGMFAIVAPIYVSEIVPARFRGFAVGIFQLGIVAGIALGGWVDYLFSHHGAWRMMLAIGIVPSVVLSLVLFIVPDTARWYAMKGKMSQSQRVLSRTYRDAQMVDVESALIQRSLSPMDGNSAPQQAIGGADLRRAALRLVMLFNLALNFFDALVGIQALNYYTPTIFHTAGFSKSGALLWTSLIGFATIVATVLGLLLIDRWGRRPLMLLALSGMTISMLGLGTTFAFGAHSLIGLAVAGILIFQVTFSFGWGMMSYIYLPEIFSTRKRASGFSTGKVFHWLLVVLTVTTFLSVMKAIGGAATFYLFAMINGLALITIIVLAPETKGKELEEIDAFWLQKVSRFRRIAAREVFRSQ